MGKIMTPAHMPIPLSLVAPLRAAVALAIVLTLSAATYRWIETPGRAIPRRWAALKPDRLPLTIKLPEVIRSGRRAFTFAKLH